MKLIFSDRFAPWGILAALLGFAFLVTLANRTMESQYTDFRVCLAHPEQNRGKRVRIVGAEILEGNRILHEEIEIKVASIPESKPGMLLDAEAIFDGVDVFVPERIELHTARPVMRSLMYLLSIPVLIVLAILTFRRFQSALPDGLFQSRRQEHA